MNVILNLQGFHSQTVETEFLRCEEDAAIVRGYMGDEERYSLIDGKRISDECAWDFWRLSPESIGAIKALPGME